MAARCAVIVLLLAACANPRVTAPYFAEPKDRAAAARQLDEALGLHGLGVSEVHADEEILRWNEMHTLTDKRTITVQRALVLRDVSNVQRPAREGIGWTLEIDATGGKLMLRFKDDQSASRAEAALRRLMREE
jgi:hypothetical protein